MLSLGMTHYTAADLAMADRHLAEGEQHIARQEMLVTSLRLKGHPTDEAESLLRLFNQAQIEHRLHRQAIAEAIDDGDRRRQAGRT